MNDDEFMAEMKRRCEASGVCVFISPSEETRLWWCTYEQRRDPWDYDNEHQPEPRIQFSTEMRPSEMRKALAIYQVRKDAAIAAKVKKRITA